MEPAEKVMKIFFAHLRDAAAPWVDRFFRYLQAQGDEC